MLRTTCFAVAIVTLLALGCGHPRQVAPVSGKVIMDGKPLTGGRIMFQPFAEGAEKRVGKVALGQIQPDGSFVLTTYDEGDGAVVGKHHPLIFGNRKPDEDEVEDPNRPVIDDGQNIGTHLLDQVCEVVAGEDNFFEIKFSTSQVRPIKDDD